MRLTIAYCKMKKRNLVLINNDTHQRETLSERPIRPPLTLLSKVSLVISFDNFNLKILKYTLSQYFNYTCPDLAHL